MVTTRDSAWLSRPIGWLGERVELDPWAQRLAAITAGAESRVVRELRGSSLGHPLHPALTDLPIGFWTSATLLDLTRGRSTSTTANTLVGWGVLSAIPTIVTGLVDVPRLPPDRRRVVVVHAAVNVGATIGYVASWMIRRDARRHRLGMLVGLAAGTAASVGGYLGGWLAQAPESERAADKSLAEIAVRLHGRRIATAESCTAGRISTALATVPGAADFLCGSLVAYHDDVKHDTLHVRAGSVYSEEAAADMVRGVCELLGADCGVATTGLAGEQSEDGVPPGTVFVATSVDGEVCVERYHFDGEPAEICELATERALADLAAALATANRPERVNSATLSSASE